MVGTTNTAAAFAAKMFSMRWIPFALIAAGCEDILSKDPGLGYTDGEAVTESGVAEIRVDITGSDSSFLLTADGDHYVAVDEIRDPDGRQVFHWDDWYSEPTSLTSAVWPLDNEMVLNWPIRGEEADLSPGTWTVTLAAIEPSTGAYQNGSKIDYTVQTKDDPSFNNANVNVRLVYTEGVDDLAEVTEAVDAAIERWTEIWAPMGLTPVVRQTSSSLDGDLPYAGNGSESIYETTLDSFEDEITLIFGETIDGSNDYLGVAGSIPGTLTANTRSAVVMGWIANAGADGRFSELDISIMGETMAHEVGHFMGLFHPVEQSFDRWDACDDTPQCTSSSVCEDQLGSNLMYPAPVCDLTTCIEQGDLSDVQVEILQRYTGAL